MPSTGSPPSAAATSTREIKGLNLTSLSPWMLSTLTSTRSNGPIKQPPIRRSHSAEIVHGIMPGGIRFFRVASHSPSLKPCSFVAHSPLCRLSGKIAARKGGIAIRHRVTTIFNGSIGISPHERFVQRWVASPPGPTSLACSRAQGKCPHPARALPV